MTYIWFRVYASLMMVIWIIEWFYDGDAIVRYALPILLTVCLGVSAILEKIDKLSRQLKEKGGA